MECDDRDVLDADTISKKENDRSTMRLVESSVTRTQENFHVSMKPTAFEEKKLTIEFDRFYDTPRDSAMRFCEQHVESDSMMNACVLELESLILQSSSAKI